MSALMTAEFRVSQLHGGSKPLHSSLRRASSQRAAAKRITTTAAADPDPPPSQEVVVPVRTDLANIFDGHAYIFDTRKNMRKYSWIKDNAVTLVSDLAASMEDGWRRGEEVEEMEAYELNQIVVVKSAANKHQLLLQDGQQRVITLCLMLAVLRDMLERIPESEDKEAHEIAQHIRKMLNPEGSRGRPHLPRVTLRKGHGKLLETILDASAPRLDDVFKKDNEAVVTDVDKLLQNNTLAIKSEFEGLVEDSGKDQATYLKSLLNFTLDNCWLTVYQTNTTTQARLGCTDTVPNCARRRIKPA